jgi:hypothetical protein
MNDKLKHKIINYLNKEYSGLIWYETDKWEDYVFFMKNDKVIFEYNKKSGKVYISYEHIWSFLSSFFGLRYTEIQDLTKEWVEEHYKLSVTTTKNNGGVLLNPVEEHYKLSVTTTDSLDILVFGRWRDITN